MASLHTCAKHMFHLSPFDPASSSRAWHLCLCPPPSSSILHNPHSSLLLLLLLLLHLLLLLLLVLLRTDYDPVTLIHTISKPARN